MMGVVAVDPDQYLVLLISSLIVLRLLLLFLNNLYVNKLGPDYRRSFDVIRSEAVNKYL